MVVWKRKRKAGLKEAGHICLVILTRPEKNKTICLQGLEPAQRPNQNLGDSTEGKEQIITQKCNNHFYCRTLFSPEKLHQWIEKHIAPLFIQSNGLVLKLQSDLSSHLQNIQVTKEMCIIKTSLNYFKFSSALGYGMYE